jgi:hypothetical protein
MSQDGFKPESGDASHGPVGPRLPASLGTDPPAPDEEDSPFARLPRYGGVAEVEHLYQCGECQQFLRTTSSYTLPTLVFLCVYFYLRTDEIMKCPRCMRRHILFRLPLTVLLANLLSPIVVVCWLWVYVRTFFSKPG